MTPAERKVVAFHEAGHTLTGWLLEHTDPIMKACDHYVMGIQLSCHQHVTLFPPGQYHPKDKRHPGVCPVSPLRPEVVLNRTGQVICFTAAALPFISTFPHSCTAVVRMCMILRGRAGEALKKRQVVQYGVSPVIGHISFPSMEPGEVGKRPYSKQLSKMIDEVSVMS